MQNKKILTVPDATNFYGRMAGISLGILLLTVLLTIYPKTAISFPKPEDDIVFEATPKNRNALYDLNEKIGYKVDIKNNLVTPQEGTVGYAILDRKNNVLDKGTIDIKLNKGEQKRLVLDMPAQASGFYHLNITINVTEYDDTLKRVFGVNTKAIKSITPKPSDFDKFWQNGVDSLRKIPLRSVVTIQPGMERDGLNCYLIEVQSWGNVVVRGWLTLSKKAKPGKKIPVWLVVPGYGGTGVKPIYGNDDLAVLAFNVRGQGNSKDVINPSKKGYLTADIQNRYKYILRGAIFDVIRAVDFIDSRPELDVNNIICSGGSMGGYLSLAASSLDSRIKICSANNPVFCDYRSLVGSTDWPMQQIQEYGIQQRIPLVKILNNLDYFDLKNFVSNLQCEALIGISFLDPLAPPYNEYTMLNNIKGKYQLFVYPTLAHEVPPPLFKYLSQWMMDQFGMF
jgi:cephalosporin-C deacetylase